jgi:dipeptidase E
MGTVFAVGGGDRSSNETRPINEAIVKEADTENPRILYIPVPGEKTSEKVEEFLAEFGEGLGCEVEVLREENSSDAEAMFEEADIIYLGGGDTEKMISFLKDKCLDHLLRKEYRNGTVMAGRSAGAICWFENGHSSSVEGKRFGKLEALGFIPETIFSPHYSSENRGESFKELLKQNRDKKGIAADTNVAVKYSDGEIEAIRSQDGVEAYIIRTEEEGLEVIEMKAGKKYDLESV